MSADVTARAEPKAINPAPKKYTLTCPILDPNLAKKKTVLPNTSNRAITVQAACEMSMLKSSAIDGTDRAIGMVESWTSNWVIASESRTRLRVSSELRSRKEATKLRLRKAFLSIKNQNRLLVQIGSRLESGTKVHPRRIEPRIYNNVIIILFQSFGIVYI